MHFDPMWLVFLLIGIVVLPCSLIWIDRRRKWAAGAETTQGTVIGLKEVMSIRDSDTGTPYSNLPSYAPIVHFHAASGQLIEFTDSLASRPARHQVGQQLSVLYHPDIPAEARLAGGMSFYTAPLALLFIGLGFTALGGTGLRMSLDKRVVAPETVAPIRSVVGTLSGQWAAENAATTGVTRMDIQVRTVGTRIRGWGKCQPVDCDWGPPASYSVNSPADKEMSLTWRTASGTTQQRLKLLPDGRLEAVTDTRYTDQPRRNEYGSIEYFRRQ